MSDFTLEENVSYAKSRAAQLAAEKHCYDAAQPFFPMGFSVGNRNDGHWDIYAQQTPGKASAWRAAYPNGTTTATDDCRERAFRIRGEAPEVTVYDERWNPHRPQPRGCLEFKSVMGAMVWIAEALMQEPSNAPR